MSNYSALKLILLFTLTVTVVSAGVCRNKDEVFVADPLKCQSYYWCLEEEAYHQTCPAGYAFNPRTKICDYPDNFECEAVTCAGATTYLAPVPRNCDIYVSCDAGKSELKACDSGDQFNSKTLKCEDERQVFCNTCPPQNPAYPVFLPDKSDCNAYYICNMGDAIRMRCDSKLEWSEWEDKCLLPDEAFCVYK